MGVAPIRLPQLGESVTEGTVDRWLKKEGDYVKRDEPIVEVVTDKVNAEIPSPFEGTLVKIAVPEGTTIPIGVEIAIIELAGADVGPAVEDAPQTAAQPAAAPAPGPAAEVVSAAGPRQRLSPAVRRLAEEHGLEPAQIAGSGEGGRVTRDDVLAFLARREAALAEPAAVAAAAETPAAGAAAAVSPPAAAEAGRVAVDGAREELVRL